VSAQPSIRLVLTGPESTGKSALTVHLAQHLGLPYALEYAREYLEQHGADYTYDILLEMSRGHKAHQARCVPRAAPLGVFDTDLTNYKIWSEVAYGKCHEEIVAALERETSHRYLLCYPDLPWEPDPLREHPHDRMKLFEFHRRELERLVRPYEIVRGSGPERYAQAEQAAARLLAR